MAEKKLDYIIDPVDKDLIKAELKQEHFVRKTNKLDNEVYVINHHTAPNVMREIGRLREMAFTLAGGGTGNEVDIDARDTAENCYDQLIVYSQEDEAIIGGYRFFDCSKVTSSDSHELSTSHYFNFSEKFVKEYMPLTIELGRSWIHPDFQPSVNPRKGLFALANLWDGLGGLVLLYPQIDYFFGKVTMYPHYNLEAKKAVLGFMQHYFPDKDRLVWPIYPMYSDVGSHEIIDLVKGLEFKAGMKVLQKYCRERNESVPPLISNYMQLSPSMRSFGTAGNPDFGDVEETGILVKISDIYDHKKDRHL